MSVNSDNNVAIISGSKPTCVSFNSQVNPMTSSALMAVLAEAVNHEHDEIHLLLNTPGGTVADGVTVYNFIRALPAKVLIYNIGTVASIGNVIYQAAHKRLCARTSSFMFHGVGFDVTMSERYELKRLREKIDHIRNDQGMISQIIARHTNLSTSEIEELFLEMRLMRADEALDGGVTDEVGDINLPPGLPIQQLVFDR